MPSSRSIVGTKSTTKRSDDFWKCVHSWPPERQSRLLQFVTGATRIPVFGFKDLHGPDRPRRFTNEKAMCHSLRLQQRTRRKSEVDKIYDSVKNEAPLSLINAFYHSAPTQYRKYASLGDCMFSSIAGLRHLLTQSFTTAIPIYLS